MTSIPLNHTPSVAYAKLPPANGEPFVTPAELVLQSNPFKRDLLMRGFSLSGTFSFDVNLISMQRTMVNGESALSGIV
jgi:hypothetical protein